MKNCLPELSNSLEPVPVTGNSVCALAVNRQRSHDKRIVFIEVPVAQAMARDVDKGYKRERRAHNGETYWRAGPVA